MFQSAFNMNLYLERPFSDSSFRINFILLCLSSAIFLGTEFTDWQYEGGAFFINYLLLFLSFIVTGYFNSREFGGFFRFRSLQMNTLHLLIANVTAYSLNRDVPVFNESVDWLSILLMAEAIVLAAIVALRPNFREGYLSHLFVAVLVLCTLLNFYQTLYTVPTYGIVLMTFWFFGLTALLWVPLLLLIVTLRHLVLFVKNSPGHLKTLVGSTATALIVLTVFVARYHDVNRTVLRESEVTEQESDLPLWVRVSQRIPANFVSERVLTAGFRYVQFDAEEMLEMNGMFSGRQLKHDPVIAIASIVGGKNKLNRMDQEVLANAVYRTRHETDRLLWNSDGVYTDSVRSTIQLFPEYRMAYTELEIDIKKKNPRAWSRDSEAGYSFYLPAGGAVTSASLWVNGEERKSILTTKSKADSAYTTIVGVERRDPLLVTWEEGNRIRARVFPVRENLPRRFKIGIVAPLRQEGKELVYDRIRFQGPSAAKAVEELTVVGYESFPEVKSDLNLKKSDKSYRYSGRLRSDWELRTPVVPLSTRGFAYEGVVYSLADYPESNRLSIRQPEAVYLDVNAQWSWGELTDILDHYDDLPIYVYHRQMQRIDRKKAEVLWDDLKGLHYSVFPVQQIVDAGTSLVVTKSAHFAPVLRDLKGSAFESSFKKHAATAPAMVQVLHLGGKISPYWRMLEEFRIARVRRVPESVELKNELYRLDDASGLSVGGSDSRLGLPGSQLQIVRSKEIPAGMEGGAPSYLARLYAYNETLRRIGQNFYDSKHLEDELISLAQLGNVVTPVSSLLTLETREDYERFGLEDKETGLKNSGVENHHANKGSFDGLIGGGGGSVPEPGEWLLIFVVLGTALFLFWKRFF